MPWSRSSRRRVTDGEGEGYFINVIGNPLDSTVAIGHLVFDGILERYPRLKIVSAHGGGYVSHYPARMDHAWSVRVDPRTALRSRAGRWPSSTSTRSCSTASSCATW